MFLYRHEHADTGTRVWAATVDPDWDSVLVDRYDNGRRDPAHTGMLPPAEFRQFERQLQDAGWTLDCSPGPDLVVHLIHSANRAKVTVAGTPVCDLDLDPTDDSDMSLLDQADEEMIQHGYVRVTDWLTTSTGVLTAVASFAEHNDLSHETEILVRAQFEAARAELVHRLDDTVDSDPGDDPALPGVLADDVVLDRIRLRETIVSERFVDDLVAASRRPYPEPYRQAMAVLVEAWQRASRSDPVGAVGLAARAAELLTGTSRLSGAGPRLLSDPGS